MVENSEKVRKGLLHFTSVERDHIPRYLTLKLAGYFAKHIQARGGSLNPPPRLLKRLKLAHALWYAISA